MKVWEGRFENRDEIPVFEEFNSSLDQDRFLFREEIACSKAYAGALERASVISAAELERIRAGLDEIGSEIAAGRDLAGFEDIHSAVELLLIERIGEAGRKLHTGRSRNEQVAAAERLYLLERIPEAVAACRRIQQTIILLAERHFDVIMPGYTHLQQAQPVLFAHYIMAVFWEMERGKARLRDALKRVNVLPLGSGALAGSTVSLDRDLIRRDLGFGAVSENSLDAVSDRSFILEILFALSLILLDLSRLMEDIIVFCSREFGFIEMDDAVATSSSLMPQKKNPDLFELARASCGRVFGELTSLFIAVKGLPHAYNKDLQADKKPLRNGVGEALRVMKIAALALTMIKPAKASIRTSLDSFLLATDLADYLVDKGVPFREAHGITAGIVRYTRHKEKGLDALSLDELRGFSPLFESDVGEVFSYENSIRRKRTSGSTHPDEVRRQIERAKARLSD
jgi:argininosuccinate lyase